MTSEQQKEFSTKLEQQFNDYKIKCVSEGYNAAISTILQMINENEPLDKIKTYCDWVLKNNDKITEVAIDTHK
ncbi:MAG: hypothetical protein RSD67_08170 [Oscillospiraceae bacterium]